MTSLGNVDLEAQLESLPDEVASALEDWRRMSLEREKIEAMLYLRFKAEDRDRTTDEVKSLVKSSPERFGVCLQEIKAEAHYERLYERLMSAKKRADMRTAF